MEELFKIFLFVTLCDKSKTFRELLFSYLIGSIIGVFVVIVFLFLILS